MNDQITIKELAQQRRADPAFLLDKMRILGLPQKSVDDVIESKDVERVLASMTHSQKKRRRTLSKSNRASRRDGTHTQSANQESPQRDNRSLQRDNRSPQRDNRSPQLDNRSPQRENKSLQRDNRSSQRESKSSQRDNRSPQRDNRSPQRDNRNPQHQKRGSNQSRTDTRKDGDKQANQGHRNRGKDDQRHTKQGDNRRDRNQVTNASNTRNVQAGSRTRNVPKSTQFTKPDNQRNDRTAESTLKKAATGKGKFGDGPDSKATQRYGIRITDEDAQEIADIKRQTSEQTLSPDAIRHASASSAVEIDNPHKFNNPVARKVQEINISGSIDASDLAKQLKIKKSILLAKLKAIGLIDESHEADEEVILDQEMTMLLADEMNYKVVLKKEDAFENYFKIKQGAKIEERSPIVTIMGHVDHGKTTLLDYIRSAKSAASEAGNITQHFGAYRVNINKSKNTKGKNKNAAKAAEMITFFDTPGHAAFSEMRARGAKLTDIVVLVVAADDGVNEQTKEAIKHAKAAGAEIVVAINKMDLEGANAEEVRKGLASEGLQPEDWGGDTQCIEISATTGKGVDELLEAINVQASIMELRAAKNIPGQGYVIESKLEPNMGPTASIILKHGELKQGDVLLAGDYYGRIKAIRDDVGGQLKTAGAAVPVNLLGLNGVPDAGDPCLVVKNDKEARSLIDLRKNQELEIQTNNNQAKNKAALDQETEAEKVDLDELFSSDFSDRKRVHLIIKADVTGSMEAIKSMVHNLDSDAFSLVSCGVGAVSGGDVNLARATDAVIIGFNVRLDSQAKQEMKKTPAPEIHYYNVIYDLMDQLDKLLSENLALQDTEKILGVALVKEVFSAKTYGQIAGCEVSEGVVLKDKPIRVLRDNQVIYEGVLESLRRFKNDVEEVQEGVECGIGVKNYKNVKVGDQIEIFEKNPNI